MSITSPPATTTVAPETNGPEHINGIPAAKSPETTITNSTSTDNLRTKVRNAVEIAITAGLPVSEIVITIYQAYRDALLSPLKERLTPKALELLTILQDGVAIDITELAARLEILDKELTPLVDEINRVISSHDIPHCRVIVASLQATHRDRPKTCYRLWLQMATS